MSYCKPSWNDRSIEAVQWDGRAETADTFIGRGEWRYADPTPSLTVEKIPQAVVNAVKLGSAWRPAIIIQTQAGDARVEPGSYIVRGTSGKLQPIAAGAFERTYVKVD